MAAAGSLLSPHDSLAGLIIYDIRLPRTVLALIVGAVLGLSGACCRASPATRWPNPRCWACPAGGAGAVIAIYFGLAGFVAITGPLMAWWALAACALTFALERNGTVALVLAGAAVPA